MAAYQLISTGGLKPSYPTPPHLKTLKLSLLDQFAPPELVHLILFYSNDGGKSISDHAQKCHQLRESLSQCLSHFYPLAGRLKQGLVVDCNDEGAEYSEGRVMDKLTDYISEPINVEALPHFLLHPPAKDVLLAVRVTMFACGGLALGVSISHKIADASTLATFLNSWATMAQGGRAAEVAQQSVYWTAPLFPPWELPISETNFPFSDLIATGGIVTRRFVLSSEKIATLRRDDRQPTRFEAVSGLFWRCFMRAMRDEFGAKRANVCGLAVKLRTRRKPPLSDKALGNLIVPAMTQGIEEWNCHEEEELKRCTERQLNEAIRKIDDEYITCLQGEDRVDKFLGSIGAANKRCSGSNFDICMISSWCRFPVYEVDFGWGKPVWISFGPVPVKNSIIMIDTKTGGGMEVWVSMEKERMDKFECDPELLSFAS